ncbi:MAG: TRAP transporter large permease subunit, partial [Rhodobacteraceae bacterium]|nr:TRAP transporter large permease subunit [Paracoccaceae bacterium]
MTDPQVALMMLGLFILIVFLGFPIAFTLMAMGIGFGYYAYFDAGRMWRAFNRLDEAASWWDSTRLWIEGFYNNRIFDLFINQTYTVMSNDVLTAVPLFLFMGYIVERANIVDRLFSTLNIASKRIPGSMGVAALITCALFATATGIVGAVVTLMGLLALPAMLKARYDTSFASGIICAGGTLGILIPPSIMLIVYAAASNVSIVRLYAGALLPGFTLVGLYLVYVIGRSILQPSVAPRPTKEEVPDLPFGKLFVMLMTSFFPLAFLILSVLGSILFGLATPSEAASIGALGGIVLAFAYRAMTWQRMRESV